MIDKGVAVTMVEYGHSLTSVAKKFKVSIARIHQITAPFKGKSKPRCDICRKPIEKKQYIEVEGGLKPFLVCDDCKEEFGDRT